MIKMARAIYEEFPKSAKLFNMTATEVKTIADISREVNAEYIPLDAPTKPFIPPLGKRYDTAQELSDALSEVKGSSPEELNRKAKQIYARASKELTSNAEEMLKLAKNHPRALALADSKIMTEAFCIEAVQLNKKSYDVLPKEMQQNEQVALNYFRQTMDSTHTIFLDTDFAEGTCVDVVKYNPNCPLDKIAPYVYDDVVRDALDGQRLPYHQPTRTHDYRNNLGSAIVLVATLKDAAPNLEKEFSEIEKKAITEHTSKEDFKPNYSFSPSRIDATPEGMLVQKHLSLETQKHYTNQQWEEYCQRHQDSFPGKIHESFLDMFKTECPPEIANKYFDLEQGITRPTDKSISQDIKTAQAMQQSFEKDPFSCSKESILRALETGPRPFIKRHFDFEGYMKFAAQQADRVKHDELRMPLSEMRNGWRTYSNAQEAIYAEKREWSDFAKTLHDKHPEYYKMFATEMNRQSEIRQHMTREERDQKELKQMSFKNPDGCEQLDKIMAKALENNSAKIETAGIDAKEYFEQRAEWFSQNLRYGRNHDIDNFKTFLQAHSEVKDVVANKLEQMGFSHVEERLKPTDSHNFDALYYNERESR